MKAGNYPIENLKLINCGHGGRATSNWVGNPTLANETDLITYPNGYLDSDMKNNPDLYLLAYGMNDADLSTETTEDRVNLYLDNMEEGLKRIRGNYPVNGRPAYNKNVKELSIIICMPTVPYVDSSQPRYYYNFHQYIKYRLMELCRLYQCAFVDLSLRTYGHKDFKEWATTTDGISYHPLHPNIWSTAQTMSALQDLIYPICTWNIQVE